MQSQPSSFTFKENILIRCFVSLLFGIAAIVIAVATFLKVSSGIAWLIPALAAVLLALALFYFVVVSIRTRQIVSVSPQGIISRSRAHPEERIAWYEVTDIREVQNRVEKMRATMPLFEVMLSLYLNLPFLAGIERRALLVFEAGERQIALRQHLIYPHRLDELRHAISRFAPSRNPANLFLDVNARN
ncbi:MAG TPA: hypothetical protein VH186_36435 [Chloroflexia bacterium]|nr:hypothetical protein [Chloroflexia bacterium]